MDDGISSQLTAVFEPRVLSTNIHRVRNWWNRSGDNHPVANSAAAVVHNKLIHLSPVLTLLTELPG